VSFVNFVVMLFIISPETQSKRWLKKQPATGSSFNGALICCSLFLFCLTKKETKKSRLLESDYNCIPFPEIFKLTAQKTRVSNRKDFIPEKAYNFLTPNSKGRQKSDVAVRHAFNF